MKRFAYTLLMLSTLASAQDYNVAFAPRSTGAPVTQAFFARTPDTLTASTTEYMTAAGQSTTMRGTAASVEIPVFAGTIDNLRVRLSGDVGGAGNDATITIQKDTGSGFSDTSQTCTVTGGAGTENTCTEAAANFSVAEGDRIAIEVTTTSGVSARNIALSWTWTSSDNNTSMLFGGYYSAGTGTRCLRADGWIDGANTGCNGADEEGFNILVPEDGFTITGMIARDSGGLSSGSRTVTLAKDGATDSTFEVTLNSGAQQASDLVGSVSLTGGTSRISVHQTSSSPSPSTGSVSVVLRATNASQRWIGASCRATTTFTTGSVTFGRLTPQSSLFTPESDFQIPAPVAFTITSIASRIETDPGGTASWGFNIREAGVDGSAVTISSGSTSAVSTGLTDTIDQDDLINWEITPTNTPAGNDDSCLSFVGDV